MKKKAAWLVRWAASMESKFTTIRGPRIVAFFDSRRVQRSLIPIVEGIYMAAGDNRVDERFRVMHRPNARRGWVDERNRLGNGFTYGDKSGGGPWLDAALVHDVEVTNSDDGAVHVRWMGPRVDNSSGDHPVLIWDIPGEEVIPPDAHLEPSPVWQTRRYAGD